MELEEEEGEGRLVSLGSPLLQLEDSSHEAQQLQSDQLVYDFTSSDYLLPFEDLKFYMDQEERLLPEQPQQMGQAGGSGSGYGGVLHDLNTSAPLVLLPPQPPPSDTSLFSWSPPTEAPPSLPRYDDISMRSSFDKDSAAENDSSRLIELQPPPGAARLPASCPSCHCDLSCTAAVVNLPLVQASCDSFLSFPENSLDIEKFL